MEDGFGVTLFMIFNSFYCARGPIAPKLFGVLTPAMALQRHYYGALCNGSQLIESNEGDVVASISQESTQLSSR